MTDQPYPPTDVDGLDPQEVLEREHDASTDVDHEPNPDASKETDLDVDLPGDDIWVEVTADDVPANPDENDPAATR